MLRCPTRKLGEQDVAIRNKTTAIENRIMPDKSTTTDPVDQLAPLMGRGPLQAHGLGPLWLVWSDVGLVRLTLPDRPKPFIGGEGPTTLTVPDLFSEPLDGYFRGEPVDLATLPVDLRGTVFQLKVWRALRKIPPGKVRTYGSVAKDVGSPRGMRAVGMANAANPLPIVVPCHRVVETGHRLGGYTGGTNRKRFLLELEGVQVVGDRVLPGQLDLW